MKNDAQGSFERSLLASGEIMRRGYSSLLKNCGKIIATLTALVVVLVTFTDVGFYDVGAKELTANVLLVLVASYIIYFSLEDAGEALGRDSDAYRAAAKGLKELAARIDGGTVGELRLFLADYAAAELAHRREALLVAEGYSPKDFCSEEKIKALDKKARRAYRRAERLRPIRISTSALLSERGRGGRGEEIKSPERGKLLTLTVKLIPTTVCTLFTASVMLGLKDGLGVAEVIEGLVRLCPLPVVALRGYSAGYSYAVERECEWIRTKCRLIEAFLQSKGNATSYLH